MLWVGYFLFIARKLITKPRIRHFLINGFLVFMQLRFSRVQIFINNWLVLSFWIEIIKDFLRTWWFALPGSLDSVFFHKYTMIFFSIFYFIIITSSRFSCIYPLFYRSLWGRMSKLIQINLNSLSLEILGIFSRLLILGVTRSW